MQFYNEKLENFVTISEEGKDQISLRKSDSAYTTEWLVQWPLFGLRLSANPRASLLAKKG